jgi:hypothetical protein
MLFKTALHSVPETAMMFECGCHNQGFLLFRPFRLHISPSCFAVISFWEGMPAYSARGLPYHMQDKAKDS